MKYQHKPTVIEAYHWAHGVDFQATAPDWLRALLAEHKLLLGDETCRMTTWDGYIYVNRGDWFIRGETEIYPCRNDVFVANYEKMPAT